MAETKAKLTSVDPVWSRVCDEASEMVKAEPLLGGLVHSSLLHHPTMERALAYRFSLKLASGDVCALSGPARLARHGVDRLLAGSSQLVPGGGRINLTLRRAR